MIKNMFENKNEIFSKETLILPIVHSFDGIFFQILLMKAEKKKLAKI